MKNRTASDLAILFFAFGLLIPAKALAIPVYYTFKGEVIGSDADNHKVGSKVEYVFRINFGENGEMRWYNGRNSGGYSDEMASENWDFHGHKFLSVNYIGGDALNLTAPRTRGFAYNWAEDYFWTGGSGVDVGSGIMLDYGNEDKEASFSMNVGNRIIKQWDDSDNWDVAQRWETHVIDVPQWSVGQGGFVFHNRSGELTVIADTHLASISTENPLEAVPEPSTLALMGLGLVGLLTAYRRARIA